MTLHEEVFRQKGQRLHTRHLQRHLKVGQSLSARRGWRDTRAKTHERCCCRGAKAQRAKARRAPVRADGAGRAAQLWGGATGSAAAAAAVRAAAGHAAALGAPAIWGPSPAAPYDAKLSRTRATRLW